MMSSSWTATGIKRQTGKQAHTHTHNNRKRSGLKRRREERKKKRRWKEETRDTIGRDTACNADEKEKNIIKKIIIQA
jgi:hypothetical protein